MNALTKVKLINELNDREAQLGIQDKVSWHSEYKDSAWVFLGGLPYELTEGDIICVFSQYGEVVNINLVRDKKTGKSKGFCFLCYEDQRSTILAVDNFNGIKIKGRTIRVDHVANYRPPKDGDDIDDVTRTLREEGCGPKAPPPASVSSESSDEIASEVPTKKRKKEKKKKKKKEKKEKKLKLEKEEQSSKQFAKSSLRSHSPTPAVRIKREREDEGYEKYANTNRDCHGDRSVDQRGTTNKRKHSDGVDEMRNREKWDERNQSRNLERDERRRNDQNSRGSCSEKSSRDSRCNHSDGRETRHEDERQSYQREKMPRKERSENRHDDRDKYRKNDHNRREERDSDCESAKSKERRSKHANGSRYKEKDDHRD
ncbi:RNA-binding motif protein, X-linked 2 [Mobula hypostoma]|uniref:RNA-binding motif protein, X-linked 2 n=1 Tax=Mobula hypostoma TaxID=723540 RepID=UPI002FC2CB47